MNQSRKRCPYCGEEIAFTAKKCRFCGEWIENTTPTPQAARAQQPSQPQQLQQPQPQQPQQPQPQPQQLQYQQPQQPQQYQQPQPQPQYQQPQQPQYQQPQQPQAYPQYQQTQPEYFQPQNPLDQQELEPDETDTPFFEAYFIKPYIWQYKDFSGVTGRKQFWLSYLALWIFNCGVMGLSMLIMALCGSPGMIIGFILMTVLSLAEIIPSLAIICRRLRDAGIKPMKILLAMIPIVGPVILFVMLCKKSENDHSDETASITTVDVASATLCMTLLATGIIAVVMQINSFFSGDQVGDIDLYEDLLVDEYVTPDSAEDSTTGYDQLVTDGYDQALQAEAISFNGIINGERNAGLHLDLTDGSGFYREWDANHDVYLDISSYNPESQSLILTEGDGSKLEGRLDLDKGVYNGWRSSAENGSEPFSFTVDSAP